MSQSKGRVETPEDCVSRAQTAEELNVLAKSRTPADRERLLLAIVDLCAHADHGVRSPQAQDLLGSVLMSLVTNAEHDIRQALAEKLADAAWPPHALINALALDDIEIARPIIAASPVLDDPDLIKLLVEATVEHQIEVALRPSISTPIVDRIVSRAEPAVMTALASNDTADIAPIAMARLVEASRDIASMRSPLARHPRLTEDMAQRLYIWVGQSLRSAIVARFRVDQAVLDAALQAAVGQAQILPLRDPGLSKSIASTEQLEMERKLIAKLHEAGQLRPSYMLRSLREQRLSLFQISLATLGDYTTEDVRRALDADRADYLALACAGVGVDRGAFATVLGLVRSLNGGRPRGDNERARRAFDAFGVDRAEQAAAAFRLAMAPV
jgi:uncharacterized protein (DUF2336 family)